MVTAKQSTVWINARIATFDPRHQVDYGLLPGLHALHILDGSIEHITPMDSSSIPEGARVTDLGGHFVTPGLIDCHTHLVFAGDRSAEWEMRLGGKTYAEIAQAGGGILSTVRATRAASEDELFELAYPRLQAIAREGVTCIEIKSGYGLSFEDELKILRVIRRLQDTNLVEISPTLLAAHAVPPEFCDDAEGYVRLICNTIIPEVAATHLAEAVDVFCETIAFSLEQSIAIFKVAAKYGLAIKAHAEQLSNSGCALEAASSGAWSVDHLEYLAPSAADILARHKTVAVLLPGAFYALREKQAPPVPALRHARVGLAVASDYNPGTSPFSSLRLMMNMACVLYGLSPAEALAGATREAARALGREGRLGVIAEGMEATLCAWDVKHPAAIVTDLTQNPLSRILIAGKERHV
jgi:imidazolonepropionase